MTTATAERPLSATGWADTLPPAGMGLFAKSLPSAFARQGLARIGWTEPVLLDRLSLLSHLKDVLQAADEVLGAAGDDMLLAVGLEPLRWAPVLRRVVRLAAAIHDLGKAGDQFQTMIRQPGGDHRQSIRHEWATLLLLDGTAPDGADGWGQWLRAALSEADAGTEWEVVRWAVAGHHPKYGRSAPPAPREGPPSITIDTRAMDGIADWLTETFDLPAAPAGQTLSWDLTIYDDGSQANGFEQLQDHFYEQSLPLFDDAERFGDDWAVLAAVAKNALVASDIAGSAIPKPRGEDSGRSGGLDNWDWIGSTLDRDDRPSGTQLQKVVDSRLNGGKLRPFQEEAAKIDGRVVLLTAGCGSGKTTAAYARAARQWGGRRLWFCYPTTGTGTEGFADYLLEPATDPSLDDGYASLVSSRSPTDFELLLESPGTDAGARLESLRQVWQPRLVACTCDSVLGLIQNNRRGLFGWPALAQSAFVFDEIHAYDGRLFSALLHFLQWVRGVPVLLMTASLPDQRRRAIEQVLGRNGETLVEAERTPDLIELETLPRYRPPSRVLKPAKRKEAIKAIAGELEAGGRVLIVCNTVARAIDLADELEKDKAVQGLGVAVHRYHSRFRYEDRIHRHREVVEAFQQTDAPAVAVCTQVAEMSLDLDATLLVTELAPVPALVQRLGRLNRNARPGGQQQPRPFVVLEPVGRDGKTRSALPYEESELDQADDWLKQLAGTGEEVSQADLAECWQNLQDDDGPPVERCASAWLDYGPANPVLELREGSPSVTVLLEGDVPATWQERSRLDVVRYALPMPARPGTDWIVTDEAGQPLLVKGLPVVRASAIDYDRQTGAEWRFDQ